MLTLTRRDADIAVRPAVTVPENLMGRRLAALATAPYASPAYLARSSAKWIEATVPVIASSTMPTRCEPCRPRRGAAGGAALPCYLGDPDPELLRLRAPLEEMQASVWLLTDPNLRRVARIRAVLDFLAHHLAEQRQLIEGHRCND